MGRPQLPAPQRAAASSPCSPGPPRGLKHPPEPGCVAGTENRPVSYGEDAGPKDRSLGKGKQDQLRPSFPGCLLLPRVCSIPLTSGPYLFGSHIHWSPHPSFGLLLPSRYFETFPPSAPATNHLSLDLLQYRVPKEGSGLPSSSLSAQPLGPPSANRRVSLGQVPPWREQLQLWVRRRVWYPPHPRRAAEGSGPWPGLWMWQALETTCNSLDVCFQGLRAQC